MISDYKPLVIAGQQSGILVELNTVQAQFYRNLEPMARAGNYWACLIINELKSLSSGHVKRNVFVSDVPQGASYTHFQMLLPGCRAYVLKSSSGKYLVYRMMLDEKYPTLQATGARPALHQVEQLDGQWRPRYKSDGKISNLATPVVAISDGIDDLFTAADNCAGHIDESNLVGKFVLPRQGFDMHHTPGGKIGGLRQINQALGAATDRSLFESASLLARTMESAKDTQDVLWLTQSGGIGVFTQAMSILKGRGVSFRDVNHCVFFSHPTTSYVKAQALAMDVGMQFDRDNLSFSALNFNELVAGLGLAGNFVAGYQRVRHDPEYNAINYGFDALKGVDRNWKAISVTSACATAISAATGAGAVVTSIPAVVTAATAMAGLGNTLFQSWLPETHRRLKNKL